MSTFDFPKVLFTNSIQYGMTVSSVYVTVQYTGTIQFQITADGGNNWEEIILVSGTRTLHNFSTTGTDLRFMAIGDSGAKIITSKDSNGSFNLPGIKIEIV